MNSTVYTDNKSDSGKLGLLSKRRRPEDGKGLHVQSTEYDTSSNHLLFTAQLFLSGVSFRSLKLIQL